MKKKENRKVPSLLQPKEQHAAQNRQPGIAVCMASYNGEKYIHAQLTAILEQLEEQDVVIVSDDGSTDQTLQILERFSDPRLQILHNPGPHGCSENFQHALRHAKADYYLLADQDDVWLPGRVEQTRKALETCDFCVCDAAVTDQALQVIHPSRFRKYRIHKGFWINLLRTRYIGCCMAFNQKVYDQLFPFPEDGITCPHDLWIAMVAEGLFTTALIHEPLILYRRHEQTLSNGGEKSTRPLKEKLRKRKYVVHCFLQRRKQYTNQRQRQTP